MGIIKQILFQPWIQMSSAFQTKEKTYEKVEKKWHCQV